MRAPLSISQIETIVKKHYPGAEQLMPLSGGLVSQTYSFRLGSAKLVFKIGDWADAYEKESYVGQVYGNLLPLRAVKGVFTNEYGVSYCFSSYLSGLKLFDLTNNELAILVPEVVRALELIAKVSVPSDAGYGVFDANGKAEFSSWVDFITSVLDTRLFNWDLVIVKGVDSEVLCKALALVKSMVEYITLDKTCLIHGDFGSYNVLAHSGVITGIIDWNLALYGDPLYDVANVLFWNERKLQPLIFALKERYLTETLNRKKVFCYMLRIGLDEVYKTVALNHIGLDVSWVVQRIDELCRNEI